MQELFNIMRKYWKPKPRSKSQQNLLEPGGNQESQQSSPPEPPAAQGTPIGEKTPADGQDGVDDDEGSGDEEVLSPRNLSEEFEQVAEGGLDSQVVLDGEATPDTRPAVDDEYLAWTLGGQLMKTPSPQPVMSGINDLTPLSKEIQDIEHLDSIVCFHKFHCFKATLFLLWGFSVLRPSTLLRRKMSEHRAKVLAPPAATWGIVLRVLVPFF